MHINLFCAVGDTMVVVYIYVCLHVEWTVQVFWQGLTVILATVSL